MLTDHPRYAIAIREARKTYIGLMSEAESIYRSSFANAAALISDSSVALKAAHASVILGGTLLAEALRTCEAALSSYEMSQETNIDPVMTCLACVEIGLEMNSMQLQRHRAALVKCRLANEVGADSYNSTLGEIVEREKYIAMVKEKVTTSFVWFVNEAKSRKSS